MKEQQILISDDGKKAEVYINNQKIENVLKYEIEREGGVPYATIKIEIQAEIKDLNLVCSEFPPILNPQEFSTIGKEIAEAIEKN